MNTQQRLPAWWSTASTPLCSSPTADSFVDHAIQLFDRAGAERFVLDFEAVTLVDVTAARALKRLLGEVKSRDAELSVTRASRAVHHQMDEAGLIEAL